MVAPFCVPGVWLPRTVSARYLEGLRNLVGTAPNENHALAPASKMDGKADEVIELVEEALRAAGAASGETG